MMEDINNLPQLPKGWAWTRLGEIADVVRGGSPRPKGDPKYFGGDIPWIMISDVSKEKGKFISKTRDTVTKEGAKKSRYLKKGTLILSNSGTVCVPKILAVDGCIHDGFVAFPDLTSNIDILYLYYYFDYIRPKIIQEIRQGVTQINLNTNIVRNITTPLPPLLEQHRIVAKTEEQFTKLDAGVEALKKINTQLKRYRQAVLKYVFEGKITEEWREIRKGKIEPASMHLKRIKEERKKNAKGKYKELPTMDTSELPQLPEGWVWTRLGGVCDTTSGGTPLRSKKEYYGGSIPWLKSGELKDNLIYRSEESITELGLANSSAKIFPKGTLLIALYGATVGKMGKLGIDATTNQAICGIFNKYGAFEGDYLFNYLISYRDNLLKSRFGGAQPNISQEIVRNILIPLLPLPEQHKIVEEIERRFSVADEVEKVVEQSLKQAERLKQSILKRAFDGKLVPQDPGDEPAEKLLDRIRAEKVKRWARRKVKRRIKGKRARKKKG